MGRRESLESSSWEGVEFRGNWRLIVGCSCLRECCNNEGKAVIM